MYIFTCVYALFAGGGGGAGNIIKCQGKKKHLFYVLFLFLSTSSYPHLFSSGERNIFFSFSRWFSILWLKYCLFGSLSFCLHLYIYMCTNTRYNKCMERFFPQFLENNQFSIFSLFFSAHKFLFFFFFYFIIFCLITIKKRNEK